METKILYIPDDLDETSYGWIHWNGIDEITTYPDWDKVHCTGGMYAIGEGRWGNYLNGYEYNGEFFGERLSWGPLKVVEAYDPIPAGDKWRFGSAKVIEEYILHKDFKKIIEKHFIPILYFYDSYEIRSQISKEMRVEAFKKLEGEMLYKAGRYWAMNGLLSGSITDEMRCKEFERLDGEWLYEAGRDWSGITCDIRRKNYLRLDGEWLDRASCNWRGIPDELMIEAFKKLEGEWLYRAGCKWECITDEMRCKEFRRLHGEDMYKAGESWKGLTKEMRLIAKLHYDDKSVIQAADDTMQESVKKPDGWLKSVIKYFGGI